MRKKIHLILGMVIVLALTACSTEKGHSLKSGNWHAEFYVHGDSIPFEFSVSSTDSSCLVTLRNGAERVPLNQVKIVGDSVIIPIPDYDTELKGRIDGDRLTGVFYRLFAGKKSEIPFRAVHGNYPRFSNGEEGTISMTGRWNIQFIALSDTEKNVGIFHLDQDILTGSVLTNTGDLRYLEGVSSANGFELSAFAGLSPYLFRGHFTDKDHFDGEFITSHSSVQLKGTRNPNAELADPYSLTHMKKGYSKLHFKLPNEKGQMVALSDPQFKGKVVIVSILGSWCPNCRDEMAYLGPWYQKNKKRGVEIVGLAFERKADPDYAWKAIQRMEKKYGATYPVLFAGKLGTAPTILPEIDHLMSYPTTLFIDKKGNVRKIHTGFNGPATGLFYDEFKKDFNGLVDQLLKE